MTRRKKSPFNNLIDLSSQFPWWLGVVLAIAAYLGLHSLAGSNVSASSWLGMMGNIDGRNPMLMIGSVGQYLVPLGCLLLAALSAYGRAVHGSSHGHTTLGSVRDRLNAMSWNQFEAVVIEAFRRKGYSVTKADEADLQGTVDLTLKKTGATYLVNCKQWRAIQVGVNPLRELYVVMSDQGVRGGMMLTTGVFTDEARAFARGRQIKLIEGKALHALTKGVNLPAQLFREHASPLTSGAPFCPDCQGRMEKLRVKQGEHAGTKFWRCMRYPDCKGKRPA